MGIPENVARGKQAKLDQAAAEMHAQQFVTAMLASWSAAFKMLSPAAKVAAQQMLHNRFADNLQLPCGPS